MARLRISSPSVVVSPHLAVPGSAGRSADAAPAGRRRRSGRLVALALAAVLPFGLAACGSSGPPTPSDPVLAQGQQVFNARCASCHGVDGGGGIAPKLAGRMTERFPDIADQIALVSGGVSGTSMRAFEDVLTPEEIEAVVRYTRESLTG